MTVYESYLIGEYQMNFDATKPFLLGEVFSNGLRVDLKSDDKQYSALVSRDDWLLDYARGKSVLHLGCTDHIPLIDKKREAGSWLHDKLTAVASSCMGIDIDAEAVDYCHSLGVENIVAGDVTRDELVEARNRVWDTAILGELIEHIDNPVNFLAGIRENLGSDINELVITTPNAFRLTNLKLVRKGIEYVNSDHRFWFTPYTLAKVVTMAGWKPVTMVFVDHGRVGIRRKIRLMGKKQLADTLLMVARHPDK